MEKVVSIGLCDLLGVAFVVLKLCGVIGWSWWWVLAPFWIPAAIMCACAMWALLAAVRLMR